MAKSAIIITGFVVLIILFYPSNIEAITYYDDYGFSIDYTDTWYVDDTVLSLASIPGRDDGFVSFVLISDDQISPNHSITVDFTKNDILLKNYENEELLKKLEDRLADDCLLFYDYFDYRCLEHSILKSEIKEIDGKKAYQITEKWSKTDGDGFIYENIAVITHIVVGDDFWIIDSISTSSEYVTMSDEIDSIINSFDLVDDLITADNYDPVKKFSSTTTLETIVFDNPDGSKTIKPKINLNKISENDVLEIKSKIKNLTNVSLFYDDQLIGEFPMSIDKNRIIVDFSNIANLPKLNLKVDKNVNQSEIVISKYPEHLGNCHYINNTYQCWEVPFEKPQLDPAIIGAIIIASGSSIGVLVKYYLDKKKSKEKID